MAQSRSQQRRALERQYVILLGMTSEEYAWKTRCTLFLETTNTYGGCEERLAAFVFDPTRNLFKQARERRALRHEYLECAQAFWILHPQQYNRWCDQNLDLTSILHTAQVASASLLGALLLPVPWLGLACFALHVMALLLLCKAFVSQWRMERYIVHWQDRLAHIVEPAKREMTSHKGVDVADAFGMLRSLFDDPSASWALQIQQLLAHVEEHHPEMYQEQWAYYVERHPVWKKRLIEVDDVATLRRFHRTLPFAYFSLRLEGEAAFANLYALQDIPAERCKVLSIENARYGDDFLSRLSGQIQDVLDCLEHLDLSNTRFGGQDIWMFLFHTQNIRKLNLGACYLGGELAWCLSRATGLQLMCLDAHNNGLDDESMHMLSTAIPLEKIEELFLQGNAIGSIGCMYLSQASHWNRLKVLSLAFNPVGRGGIQCLSQSTWAAGVETLNLQCARFDAESVEHLASAFTGLKVLNLSNNAIGNSGARMIARSAVFQTLTELSLCGCGINDVGAMELANSAYLSNVTMLDLSRNALTTVGIAALAHSPYLRSEIRAYWEQVLFSWREV